MLALLTHPNIRQAAKSVGIHERTLRRWLATPHFSDDLEQGVFTAVAALRDLAANKYTSPPSRVAASKNLLECCERRTLRYDLVSLLRRP